MPHFLSIYLSRSEGLVTTQHNLKGKNQIKTTFFQRCVCTVEPCELLGSEKQPGRLLLIRGNLFPIIYLEILRWELSCRFTVTLHPSRSSARPPPTDTRKVLARTPQLVATHKQDMFKAWFYIYGGNISISAFNGLLSLLLPLYDQLQTSSFVSLSSSIMGLHKALPIDPIWGPTNVNADISSLFG